MKRYVDPEKRAEVEVDSRKTMADYFGDDTDEAYTPVDHPIKQKFLEKLQAIQHTGFIEGELFEAQVLQMIAVNYHWHWDRIPYGRMDEVKTWVKNNAHRYYQIVHPELHEQVMGRGKPLVVFNNLEDVQRWCQDYRANFEHKNQAAEKNRVTEW